MNKKIEVPKRKRDLRAKYVTLLTKVEEERILWGTLVGERDDLARQVVDQKHKIEGLEKALTDAQERLLVVDVKGTDEPVKAPAKRKRVSNTAPVKKRPAKTATR